MDSKGNGWVERLKQEAKAAGWGRERLVNEVHQRLGISLLQAHRRVNGWTQKETADKLGEIYERQFGEASKLSHQQVSKWESGIDKPEKYLDAVCQLYETRPDKLGLARDYSHETAGEPSTEQSALPRRTLLALPLGVAASGLGDLESVRQRLEGLVRQASTPVRELEHWEAEIYHLGAQIRVMDPGVFRIQTADAMQALCDLLERRQTVEAQRRLGESIARLAGLIAIHCNAVGNVRNMHTWFHLAQTLADEYSDDRAFRSWSIAYEAMSYLWHGKSLKRAQHLAWIARSMAPKGSTSAPLATIIEARVLARVGRTREALAAIDTAEAMWTDLDPQVAEENTFGFYEHLLRMYQSDVLTVLGTDFGRAQEVQERAIGLARSQPGDIDTALVRLDQAICLAKRRELSQSCRVAKQAITAVPDGFKSGTAAQKARSIVDLIVAQGGRKLVAELEQMLREVAA